MMVVEHFCHIVERLGTFSYAFDSQKCIGFHKQDVSVGFGFDAMLLVDYVFKLRLIHY